MSSTTINLHEQPVFARCLTGPNGLPFIVVYLGDGVTVNLCGFGSASIAQAKALTAALKEVVVEAERQLAEVVS